MEKNSEEKEVLFICQCGDTEHQMIMRYEEDENLGSDWSDVFVSVHLVKYDSIFKRIKHAFKYIFGYTSIYGDFDEFIFKPKDWQKLQNVVNYLKKIDKKQR